MKIQHPPVRDMSRISMREAEAMDAARVDCDDLRDERIDLVGDAVGGATSLNDLLRLRDLLSRQNAELRALNGGWA